MGGLIQAWPVYVEERPTTCKMQVGKSLVIGLAIWKTTVRGKVTVASSKYSRKGVLLQSREPHMRA